MRATKPTQALTASLPGDGWARRCEARYNIGMSSSPFDRYPDPFGDDAIDVARYLGTLRRNALLIAAIVSVFTVSVLGVSVLAPEVYDSSADVVVLGGDSGFSSTADAEMMRRELATLRSLVTTRAVLQPAAQQLGVGVAKLRDRITSSVDAQGNILSIAARGQTATDARDAANTVARSFVRQREQVERARLAAVIDALSREISDIEAADGDSDRQQLQALGERRAQLVVAAAAAGTNLHIAQEAELSNTPSGPRPLRNAVLALFGSLLLAVLVALARDRLRARLTPRDLTQVLDAPVLVTLPAGGSRPPDASARAAYQTLAALLRLSSGRSGPQRVLVASAVQREGATTVVHALGIALVEAGERVLVVCCDVQRPDLDERFGVRGQPGLCDLLVGASRDGVDVPRLDQTIIALDGRDRRLPDVLAAGTRPERAPGEVLDLRAVKAVLDEAGRLGYGYVLLNGPPATGNNPDFPVLAAACGEVLIVAELDHFTATEAANLRERLDALTLPRLGLVVVDGGAAPPWPGQAVTDGSRHPASDPVGP